MITEENVLLILVASVAIMGITSLVVNLLIRRRIGRRAVETEISTRSEWSLGAVAEPGRRYNLCLKFTIEHHGGEDNYGLVVDYSCHAGGKILVSERAGIGDEIPPERDRNISTQYNTDLTAIGGWSKYRATIVLCSAGPFEERCEMRATGMTDISQKASLKKGLIFFST